MSQKVVVVGSYNADMIIKAPRLPRLGETILGGRFHTSPGGKGANQAVAAARAGANVVLVARVGDDLLGQEALRGLQAEGVNTDHVSVDHGNQTGTAWIIVDDRGENCIVVASGANACLSPDDILRAEASITASDILLMQLECPVPALERAMQIARRDNVTVILNPAPAMPLSAGFLSGVSIITPNEVEAEMLTGVKIGGEESLVQAAGSLHNWGIGTVIITLGARGAFLSTAGEHRFLPAFQVTPVDTTAAGDVFSGCLAAFADRTHSLQDAVRVSMAAAALSVTKLGAQDSAPTLEAITQFLAHSPR
ncbi:MAG TPA: ribokinase [Bacteroidota bacterium]